MTTHTVSERELVIERTFAAPISAVWKAWSDPEQIVLWWGPQGFSTTTEIFSFEKDGDWKYTMHGPDGRDYPDHMRFKIIQEPSLIVIEHMIEPRFEITVDFEDLGAEVRMKFQQRFVSQETFDAVKEFAVPGSLQMIDKLQAHVTHEKA